MRNVQIYMSILKQQFVRLWVVITIITHSFLFADSMGPQGPRDPEQINYMTLFRETEDPQVGSLVQEEKPQEYIPAKFSDSDDDPVYMDIDEEEDEEQSLGRVKSSFMIGQPRIINNIIVEGNKMTAAHTILSYVPYRIGEVFNPNKSRALIRNLYYELKRLRNISLYGENIGDDRIDLHIVIEEKIPLKDIVFHGNRQIGEGDLKKKINFDIPAIDDEELKRFIELIRRTYAEKGYNRTEISARLDVDQHGKAIAYFDIKEKPRTLIKQIFFQGNTVFSDKELRKAIISKEDWVLGFLDQSGFYHPDKVDYDRHLIEQLYKNKGYAMVRVGAVQPDVSPQGESMTLTYSIEEGPQYFIKLVEVQGNDLISAEILQRCIPIKPGDVFSQEALIASVKMLETIWGNYGYIFAQVSPLPDVDEENHLVSLKFLTDLGNPVRLNRLLIKGNTKTRDKIIRRRIGLEEGALITKAAMDSSKSMVESLGYFDPRDGVNWKVVRLNEDEADLILNIKEGKTGAFNLQLGYGGSGVDISSPSDGVNVKAFLRDTNLFGRGININFEASWAQDEQTVAFHIGQPWLFDRPVSGALDIYHRRPTYDELKLIQPTTITEKLTGGSATLGIITPATLKFFGDVQVLGTFGAENIHYQQLPKSYIPRQPSEVAEQYQIILDQAFRNGTYVNLSGSFEQDYRNHPVHTTRGYKWRLLSKLAVPADKGSIGFYKLVFDGHYFAPLINEIDLVFHLRGYFGIIAELHGKYIPYGELFHIGGLGSVRGFTFGQIGPKFQGDPIGGTRALFVNAELIFPITPDLNLKGVVFYDGGAGFNAPYIANVSRINITGNSFDYRHSVGFGIHLLNPMPVRVYWGFKLDPRIDRHDRTRSESASEVHFTMSYDW